MLKYKTLLLDTQCQGSNWVAANIVEDLGAQTIALPEEVECVSFTGDKMTASRQTVLDFKNSYGGPGYRAKFLVSAIEKVPFEMVLGVDDILALELIEVPDPLLGLGAPIQTKGM